MTPPDFDQLARSIVDRVESHIREPFIPGEDDPVRETVIKQIAAQLRQVWNARGAADITAVDTKFGEVWATVGPMIPDTDMHAPANIRTTIRVMAGAIRKVDVEP